MVYMVLLDQWVLVLLHPHVGDHKDSSQNHELLGESLTSVFDRLFLGLYLKILDCLEFLLLHSIYLELIEFLLKVRHSFKFIINSSDIIFLIEKRSVKIAPLV